MLDAGIQEVAVSEPASSAYPEEHSDHHRRPFEAEQVREQVPEEERQPAACAVRTRTFEHMERLEHSDLLYGVARTEESGHYNAQSFGGLVLAFDLQGVFAAAVVDR